MFHFRRLCGSLLFYLISTSGVLFGGDADLLEQLLDYSPPRLHWTSALADHVTLGQALPDLSSISYVPADEAPVAQHLNYWSSTNAWADGHVPTPVVRQKVLAAALQTPPLLPSVWKLLPQTEAAALQVAELLDGIPDSGSSDSDYREVRAWVFEHSGLLRDAMIADVIANLNEKYVWRDSESLRALWRVDPAAATLLCRQMALSEDWKQRVVGAKNLWEHEDVSADWRAVLIEAAGNPACDDAVRQEASRSLLASETPERTEWMLETLQSSQEWPQSGFQRRVFGAAVRKDPDFWIPQLIPFVDGPNRQAHERAVSLLVQCHVEHSPADALRPLLPWLMDPDWSSAGGRLHLVKSLEHVSMPESIDGLIYILEQETDRQLCFAATAGLASYNARQALPVLKSAFERMGMEKIFGVIDQLDGYTTAEQLAFIEAYYEFVPEATRAGSSRNPLENRFDEVPGEYYISKLEQSACDLLFEAVEARAQAIAETNPALAEFLSEVLLQSASAQMPDFLASSLKSGVLSATQLIGALEDCRNDSWETAPFASLAQLPGVRGACSAVLSRDSDLVLGVLCGTDVQAQTAVLAASRISGDILPVEAIESAMAASDDRVVSAAALDYLSGRRDQAARQLYVEVRDRLQREGVVEFADDLNLKYERRLDALAEVLRQRFGIEQAPLEVYGLLSSGTWGGRGQRYLLVFSDQCLAVQDFGGGRLGIATISDAQFEAFQSYIDTYQIDSLPALRLRIDDGVQYDYIHYDGVSWQSVFMNNPPTDSHAVLEYVERDPNREGIILYAGLMRHFLDLFESLDFELSYGGELSILLPREQGAVQAVWKEDDALRVLIEYSREAKVWQGFDPATGELTGMVPEPADCSILDVAADMPSDFQYFKYHMRHPTQVRSGDAYVRSGTFRGVLGLWLCQSGADPELLAEGRFMGEWVSSDGKWCAVAQALGRSWAEPNTVVFINVETRELFPIDLEPADTLKVICYLPSHAQFLVFRARNKVAPGIEPNAGPESPEYYLLDPESGISTPVTGDFDVLMSLRSLRPLQTVEGADGDWVWGAEIQSMSTGGFMTVVGRYDRHDFKFEAVLEVPGVRFEPTDMWVDTVGDRLYFVLNRDLVCMPLGLHTK
jgi:hypothetical protein